MTTAITPPKLRYSVPYVYISPMNWQYAHLFTSKEYSLTSNIHRADIVVFTGGPDVNPALYNENPIPIARVQCDMQRDEHDIKLWEACTEDQLKIGICRGAQFLNVMMGGGMYQDVSAHTTAHSIDCAITNSKRFVTSTHHQMMRPNFARDDLVVVAKATGVSGRKVHPSGVHTYKDLRPDEMAKQTQAFGEFDTNDYEVLWYDKDLVLCFQPHPEFTEGTASANNTYDYFHELLSAIFAGGATKED